MIEQLASDPGAWNIIGWILILAVGGSAVLWLVSTLLLRSGRHRTPVSGREDQRS
jgi:hypothetical protein